MPASRAIFPISAMGFKATVALENVDWKKNSEYILILPPLIAPGL